MAYCGSCGSEVDTPYCKKCGAATGPVELWGTFAVNDHTRKRAFVAEAVLFDRLVIPTPPDWDDLTQWPADWQPKRLRSLIGILGNRAIPLPWDASRRDRWHAMYTEIRDDLKVESQYRQDEATNVEIDVDLIRSAQPGALPEWVTRKALGSEVKATDIAVFNKILQLPLAPGTRIESVAAYGSLDQFRHATNPGVNALPQRDDPPQAMYLAWDFFVPEQTDLSDERILEKVVALNDNKEFVEHRQAFQRLRLGMSAQHLAADQARREIEERLTAYNRILATVAALTAARRVVTFISITAALLEFVHLGLGTATSVSFGLAEKYWDRWVHPPKPGEREKAVAVVHDVREAFNWASFARAKS